VARACRILRRDPVVANMELSVNQALLVVDVQNDYFPGGAMVLDGAQQAGEKAGQLVQAFRARGRPVIHMQHVSTRPGATFFVANTKGVEIHESVSPHDGETVFQKHFPNSFRDTPLLDHLRQREIESLVIVGMMTQMCIDTTTRAAADLGFDCLVGHDACATRALAFDGVSVPAAQVQAAFLAALNGSFAKVQSVQDLAAAVA
jgi:nicotinamidase-related amidase